MQVRLVVACVLLLVLLNCSPGKCTTDCNDYCTQYQRMVCRASKTGGVCAGMIDTALETCLTTNVCHTRYYTF